MRLVGRETELGALQRLVDTARQGGFRVLCVRGEAGIGKTQLLEVLRVRAKAAGLDVLEGRATELEQDVALAPVVEALEGRILSLPPGFLASLGPEQVGRLAAVFPGLGAPSIGAGAADRWRLHRTLRNLLAGWSADRPIVLILDDLHWADPATREFLDQLLRHPLPQGGVVALAMRPGEVAARLQQAARSGLGSDAVLLELRSLDRPAADLLLADVPDRALRDRLYRASGGNPLLLEELRRSDGEVPAGLVEVVMAEVAGLPVEARELLAAAAVLGDPFDVDHAGRVAGLDEQDRLTGLDLLVSGALVRVQPEPRQFAFRHPVVRSAVYQGLAPGRRLGMHHNAARLLADLGAGIPLQARHLAHSAAIGDTGAAAILRSAARQIRPQSPATAAEWLAAAERLGPSPEGSAELAEVLVEAGRLTSALAVTDSTVAESAVPEGPTLPLALRLALTAASAERLLGRHDAARLRLERMARRTVGDAELSGRLEASLALAAYQRGELGETRRWARAAREREVTGPVRAAAAALLAMTEAFAGHIGTAADEADQAVADLAAASDEELLAAGELCLAVPWALLALERLPDALSTARRAAQANRRGGNSAAAVASDIAAASALGLGGQMAEADAAADAAEQAAHISGIDQTLQWALWMRAWTLLETGHVGAALVAAERSVALAEKLDVSALAVIARAVLGAVLVARGEPERARPLLAAYDLEPGWICRWAPWLVEADLALGDLDAAGQHAARAGALGEAGTVAGAAAGAARACAMVDLARGDTAAAARRAREAVRHAQRIPSGLDEARGLILVAQATEKGDPAESVAALDRAQLLSAAAGATRTRDEVLQHIRRRGRRADRGHRRAVDAPPRRGTALTAREQDVAELVAAGRTNKEIGSQLYLSEKTIETHLSRVFTKFGVRTRAAVAARMAADRDAPP